MGGETSGLYHTPVKCHNYAPDNPKISWRKRGEENLLEDTEPWYEKKT